jgi:thymidine kinase
MHVVHGEVGWIEVICGPMFSGKSEELIRRLKRAAIARQKLQIFKPAIDDRYHETRIVSHSDHWLEAVAVKGSADLARAVLPETRVVGVDEVQFFDAGIVEVIERLADRGVRVVVAGLDQDYTGKPFEPLPRLLALAEYVTKALAICAQCGAPAGRSQRLVASEERVVVGATDAYEPRCRRCHTPRAEGVTEPLVFE